MNLYDFIENGQIVSTLNKKINITKNSNNSLR